MESSSSDAGYAHSQSLISLPGSPLSTNYSNTSSYHLSSSLANMSLCSGGGGNNGLQSSGSSSKSHSPAGSTTSTLTLMGKRSETPAHSENGDEIMETAKVKQLTVFLLFYLKFNF